MWIIGQQTNPLYRTYVDTTWLLAEAGETRQVRVMVEYALDPRADGRSRRTCRRDGIEQFLRRPNDLGLHAYAEDARTTTPGTRWSCSAGPTSRSSPAAPPGSTTSAATTVSSAAGW